MRYSPNIIKSIFALLAANIIPMLVLAQDAPKPVSSLTSPLAMVMITIAFILAFVIWGMGHVLITLGKHLLEKNKQSGKTLSVILLIGFAMMSQFATAQTTDTKEVVETAINYGGMNSTGFWTMATVIFIELIAICFMMFFINRIQKEILPQEAVKKSAFMSWWNRMDSRFFTKAVAVEKEADVLLDHDYDGIKELDNSLPPWWKYGFYVTILVAFVYIFHFHVMGSGKNPTEEYESEMENAKIAMEIYASKNADKVDEKNLKMPDNAGLAKGKEIFESVCWTCHGKAGEGGAGPNLTDDYWIHKGSLTDIYMSIKKGYPDKGMQAWEKNYSPKEINDLAGYIKTIRGTNPPNPKPAQGDLYTETVGADSTATTKPDSTALVTPAAKDSVAKK